MTRRGAQAPPDPAVVPFVVAPPVPGRTAERESRARQVSCPSPGFLVFSPQIPETQPASFAMSELVEPSLSKLVEASLTGPTTSTMPAKARKHGNVIVIGVIGVSASGKSTLAAQVASALPGGRVLSADDHFDFDSYMTDTCPLERGGNERVWKNWESPAATDMEPDDAAKKAKH